MELDVEFVPAAVEFVPVAVLFPAAAGVVVFVVAPWTPPDMFNVSIPTIIKSTKHLDDLDDLDVVVDVVAAAAAADEERPIAPHRGACTTVA